jgi:hypothetical protein
VRGASSPDNVSIVANEALLMANETADTVTKERADSYRRDRDGRACSPGTGGAGVAIAQGMTPGELNACPQGWPEREWPSWACLFPSVDSGRAGVIYALFVRFDRDRATALELTLGGARTGKPE